MADEVEQLPWDSEFFGIPIGRIRLDDVDVDGLRAREATALDLGIECLYGTLDPSDLPRANLVQTMGYRLMDVAITFERPTDPLLEPPNDDTVVRVGTPDDLPAIDEAAAKLAVWSRFAVDPRFGIEAARRLHRAWVSRAAHDGDQWVLMVAEDGSGVSGFTTRVTSPEHRIDLIGVTRPGMGASWALVAHEMTLAPGPRTYGGPIPARNVPAIRFVEHMGYKASRSQYVYHRWLDEPAVHA